MKLVLLKLVVLVACIVIAFAVFGWQMLICFIFIPALISLFK